MSEHRMVSRLLSEDGGSSRTLPIACRFVPMDQWMVTHIDTSWKIKEIKHWILSKCNAWGQSANGQPTPNPPRFRPASPVTFAASRRSSFDSSSSTLGYYKDGDVTEDGEDDDWDVFAFDTNREAKAVESGAGVSSSTAPMASSTSVSTTLDKSPLTRSTTKQEIGPSLSTAFSSMSLASAFQHQEPPTPPAEAAKYILYSFSCGHVLEDEASLSWYKLRPFELLEVHRLGAVVPLPRRSALAYAEPYFESLVCVSERGSGRLKARKGAGASATTFGVRGPTAVDDQGGAHSLEWKNRWALIRDGVLNLCKDPSGGPTHRFPFSSLSAIRGPEEIDLSARTHPRVVSLKFKLPNAKPSATLWTSAQTEWHPNDKKRRKPPKSSTWVVLNLPNANAHESLLRILHRLAPIQTQSSFVPSNGAPTKTPNPSPISRVASPISPSRPEPFPVSSMRNGSQNGSSTLFSNYGLGVQYPEWRHALFDRVRHAGLGDVGPAMAHYLCGTDKDPASVESVESGLRRQASTTFAGSSGSHHSFSHGVQPSISSSLSSTGPSPPWVGSEEGYDYDNDDEDDMESLLEWDGWTRDIARRSDRHPPVPSSSNSRRQATDREDFVEVSPFTSPSLSTSPKHKAVRRASTMIPSSPSSSSEHSADRDWNGMRRSSSAARRRALSFAPPHILSDAISSNASSGSSTSPSPTARRSRSNTVSSTRTITPDVKVAAPVSTPMHALGRTTSHENGVANGDSSAFDSGTLRRAGPSLRLSLAPQLYASTSALGVGTTVNVLSPSSSSRSKLAGSLTSSGNGGGSGGMGGMKRIVRGVSLRGAISAGSDRLAKGFEDALDFVDGK